jgi:hypothetical protein
MCLNERGTGPSEPRSQGAELIAFRQLLDRLQACLVGTDDEVDHGGIGLGFGHVIARVLARECTDPR